MSSVLQIPAIGLHLSISSIHSAERYWQRCLAEMARLRDEVRNFGSKYMNQQEMHTMLGYSEHGLLMLCQQRSVLSSAVEDFSAINRCIISYGKLEKELPPHQALLMERVIKFDDAYLVSEESLSQLSLMLKTALQTGVTVEGGLENIHKIISSIEKHVELVHKLYNPRQRDLIITHTKLEELRSVRDNLMYVIDDISQHIDESSIQNIFPTTVFSSCLESAKNVLVIANECICVGCVYKEQSTGTSCPNLSQIEEVLSSLIQTSLLVAQSLNHNTASVMIADSDLNEISGDNVWESHGKAVDTLSRGHMNRIVSRFNDLTTLLMTIEFGSVKERVFCTQLLADATTVVTTVLALFHRELIKLSNFHCNASKFQYVILRIFRTLIAQGYCSDDTGDNEQSEGDMKSSKFEDDVAGTGMGEGEGKIDVSDQIENEEQLLGLKNENNNESESKEANKELEEDEAKKGMEMEMEADFEGDLFEGPKKEDEKAPDSDENMEDIDRELGDGNDLNDEVIDEKLWDDDDDEDNADGDNDKFEKNSKVNNADNSNEVRTKDDEDDKMNEDPAMCQREENNAGKTEGQEDEQDNPVNVDLEENYED